MGHGSESFARLVDALMRWDVHREAGLSLGSTDSVAMRADVVPVKWLGPVGILLPCRVIEVVDEPRTQGFVYATLRGHPEDGEERFTVVLTEDDEVYFRLEARSRSAGLLPRLARPVADLLQDRATRACLAAAQRLSATGES